jgi:DNA-binding CsgD family transcriptional regulator
MLSGARLRRLGLTGREADVMRLVALGHTNGEVAEALELSSRTVEKHLENVYTKLGVHGRTAAVAAVLNRGRGGS